MTRSAQLRLRPPPSPRVWWVWLIPPGVVVAISMSFFPPINGLERLVGAAVGLVLIFLASRRPDRAILVLIIGLPFQNLVLAQLFTWGGAGSQAIVRPLASWKEAMAVGVLLAGIQGFRAARRKADALDLVALAFVAIVALYAIFPDFFAPDAPTGSNARSLAFRSMGGFVLLLLGARHAQLPDGFIERAARVVLGVGFVVAAIAVYEFTFSDSWNDFVVNRVKYPQYQLNVLNNVPRRCCDIRSYGQLGGREFVRVGSVTLSPLVLPFYLLPAFAVGVERALRQGLRSYSGAALGFIGAALILTQTRSALIGAAVVAVVAFRPAAGRDLNRRIAFTFVLVVGLIFAVPGSVATGLSDRVTATATGEEESADTHIESFHRGVGTIGEHPLGLGLGTSAGVGQRFEAQNLTITENYYLQVGIELGVVGMGVFIVLTLVMLRRLRQAQLAVPSLGIAAARSAGLGLAVGSLLLHTWTAIPVAWTFFAFAGVALGAGERSAASSASSERSGVTY